MSNEAYFTPANLHRKARMMLADLQGCRARHNQTLDPKRSALLVIDMQRYFVDESSGAYLSASAAIIPGILRVIDCFSHAGSPIFFTRHLNTDVNAGMMSSWWHGDLIRPEDPLSEISPRFDVSKGTVIEKSRYDAFYQTQLGEILHGQNINQVIICGVMTHLCCETTARSAFMRGFEVFFAVDGTATQNEAFHRAALLNLAHGFAVPVLIEEIVAGFANISTRS
ncbi:MAG: isochorismatase family protein [Dehalococcoidia bacterium]|nr:isochorismatase family protein [Dehalococcoidia bacterium]